MKVKVGNKIYDGKDEPVMVILEEGDKENIRDMLPECTKNCMYPEGITHKAIKKWMG